MVRFRDPTERIQQVGALGALPPAHPVGIRLVRALRARYFHEQETGALARHWPRLVQDSEPPPLVDPGGFDPQIVTLPKQGMLGTDVAPQPWAGAFPDQPCP
jgi:hypothetical protein